MAKEKATTTTGRINIPGLQRSKGMSSFDPLVPGDYALEIKKVQVKAPKNNSPTDVYNFELEVLEGPPQLDGKAAKGRKAWHNVNVLLADHPSYKPEWDDPTSGQTQMGVDELKTMIMAAGVEIKKDTLDIAAFVGTELRATVVQTVSTGDGKTYSNFRKWAPM